MCLSFSLIAEIFANAKQMVLTFVLNEMVQQTTLSASSTANYEKFEEIIWKWMGRNTFYFSLNKTLSQNM